ncbi:MAG: Uncharacterized protein G01um101433_62 [Parcubacteria group bacterium Gr01-1014_33]|nr:MAG: Uncharacterized protein G01um101433_62 [Parcubacteria group bacterium Gr01-1014_33]
MDMQNAIDVFEKSEHVGIIIPAHAGLDILASAEVLNRVLLHQGKIVGFPLPLPTLTRFHMSDTPFTALASAQALPKEFVISVDTIQSPVSQLRYEKQEDHIDITLSPKSIPIQEGSISFHPGKTQCDTVIAIGIPDIEPLKASTGLDPDFFAQNPVINIDSSPENTGYGTIHLTETAHAAVSEIVSLVIRDWRPQELTPDISTLLLAGILEHTNAFSAITLQPETFTRAASLLQNGADYEKALALESNGRDITLLQLFGRASVRSKVSRDRHIVWSFLTREDFEKTNRSSRDIPATAAHIKKEFGFAHAIALVWQDPETKKIRADITGTEETRTRIRARAEGENAASLFRLTRTFATFQEAEEYLSPLLGEAL